MIDDAIAKHLLHMYTKWALRDSSGTTGADRTCYVALGHLVGITPQAAVKTANRMCPDYTITTTQFCEWLANQFSEFAANVLNTA